jgi:hypothetical protein
MRAITSLAITMAVVMGASAQSQTKDLVVQGVGLHPCSTFAQEYKDNPLLTEGLYYNWAIGFMSGYNASLAEQNNLSSQKNLRGRDLRYQLSFLRNHCFSAPSEYYVQAVRALYDDLPLVK